VGVQPNKAAIPKFRDYSCGCLPRCGVPVGPAPGICPLAVPQTVRSLPNPTPTYSQCSCLSPIHFQNHSLFHWLLESCSSCYHPIQSSMTAGSFVSHMERRRRRGVSWREETWCEEAGYLEARKQEEGGGGGGHISGGEEPRLRGEGAR